MFCKNCGKELDDKAIICPGCGVATDNFKKEPEQAAPPVTIINTNNNANTNTNTNMNTALPVRAPKSKMTALILCLVGLLGFGGLHQFYVGKTGMGILYLLTAGFFGFGTVIDAIRILTGGFKDKYGVPVA